MKTLDGFAPYIVSCVTRYSDTPDEELGDQRVGLRAVVFKAPLDGGRWILRILERPWIRDKKANKGDPMPAATGD